MSHELTTVASNVLREFEFVGSCVRVVMIKNATWFSAEDVCRQLDVRTRDIMSALDEDEKLRDTIAETVIDLISESGLYSVILRSRKSGAKRFRRWITHEVLPIIRQTGSYGCTPQPPATSQLSLSDRRLIANWLLDQAQAVVDGGNAQPQMTVGAPPLALPTPPAVVIEPEAWPVFEPTSELPLTLDTIEVTVEPEETIPTMLSVPAYLKANGIEVDTRTAVDLWEAATRAYWRRYHQDPPIEDGGPYGPVSVYDEALLRKVFATVRS